MIGREDAHNGIRVRFVQYVRGKRDTWRCIPLRRLSKDLLPRDVAQLLPNLRLQQFVGNYPDVGRLEHAAEAIDCLLNQAALAEELENLFGASLPAAWPKPRTAPAGHDKPVSVIAH